jgi:hypothetical protein
MENTKSVNETKVIAIVYGSDAMSAHVAIIETGYSVALKDEDSGEFVDLVKIFPTEAAALAYAQTLVK